ncbi:MAG: peptidoglycan DD-metalloendopeptidase family protein [Bacilli bacterium]
MKKILSIILIVAIVIPGFIVPSDVVSAKTLGDMKNELKKLEEEYAANQQQKELTEQEINNVKNTINSIDKQIAQINIDVKNLSDEIVKLNEDIKKKEQEVKDIVSFIQVSNGESAYLEYAFGAKDFTDFIYRMAISEQLTSYNDKLVDEYNQMIKDNEQKKKDLADKEKELQDTQKKKQEELAKLGTQLKQYVDIKVSIEDDIKSQKDAIKLYSDLGCKDNEDISVCGRSVLPPETSFWRPVNSAYISSNFGNRCYTIGGKYTCDFHSGVDMAASGNVPVYAIGKGVVADTVQWSCGGRIIFINHSINGVNYTSVYMHLRRILVSKGDVVSKDTQIAVMGGNPSTEYWDSCSTGQHLHLTISYGLYQGWSGVINGLINPRNLVNFPAYGSSFYDRTTRY